MIPRFSFSLGLKNEPIEENPSGSKLQKNRDLNSTSGFSIPYRGLFPLSSRFRAIISKIDHLRLFISKIEQNKRAFFIKF